EAPSGLTSGGGFGLLSVREQIARLGGSMTIESVRGLGTRASIRVPLETNGGQPVEQPEGETAR
ncbi:MAG TPA: hypothetical protein VF395_03050, partial [Polyangiaceae bacterium]